MKLEFQKLRSTKVPAEVKAQTLETDLVPIQQERDVKHMSFFIGDRTLETSGTRAKGKKQNCTENYGMESGSFRGGV